VAGTSVNTTSDMAPSHSEIAAPSHGHHVHYNPDAPSEQWGWHGTWREFAPRGRNILLGLFAATMFLMLIGNHVSRVENYYLVGIGILMIIWMVRGNLETKKARRRR
jgi:Protein of unknown function (DUF2631)